MAKRGADQRRTELREQLWPESRERIWTGPGEKGYWCAPRVLPLLLHLTSAKSIVGNKDCSTVYIELLSRDFGQGIVEIQDEDEHAYCAGYISDRARRTWQERVKILEKMGLIEVARKGNRPIGYILIVHPLKAVQRLKEEGQLDEEWWSLFQAQLRLVGALPLEDPVTTPTLRLVPGGGEVGPVPSRARQRKARET